MDENGITEEIKIRHTLASFSEWFVNMNNKCLSSKEDIVSDIYNRKSIEELGKIVLRKGKHANESIETIYQKDKQYLEWHSKSKYEYAKAVKCYLRKVDE